MTAPSKPPPPLHRRLGYFALMMIGVGLMLLAVAGDESSKERIATFVGLGFLVPGIVLLAITGASDWHRRVFGRRDVEAPKTVQQNFNSELTDTERALINFLRDNEVSPHAVAEAIREVLERRLGR
jgi:hypothetical protein